jgi:hypothetical protein
VALTVRKDFVAAGKALQNQVHVFCWITFADEVRTGIDYPPFADEVIKKLPVGRG